MITRLKTFLKRKLVKEIKLAEKRVKTGMEIDKLPPSVMFFTTHKCASSFIHFLFSELVKESDYQTVDYARIIRAMGDETDIYEPFPFLERNYSVFYRQRGEIYAPNRRPVNFEGMSKFKQIYFLRDPRDVLVSGFYSFGKTHQPPPNKKKREQFMARRARIQEQGIDMYAIENAKSWLKPIFEQYRLQKEEANDSLYLSYDLFKDDTVKFVNEITKFIGIELSNNLTQMIAKKAAPVQDSVKEQKHKRSGKSRQFEKDLKKETQDILNELFEEDLKYWNFEI